MNNSSYSVWRAYGFRESLFSTLPIRASKDERKLLVGRRDELTRALRQLGSGVPVVAIEGDYGVGKTSLAAAIAYDASQWKHGEGPLFMVCEKRFGLRAETKRESFERDVILALAQTIVEQSDMLQNLGYTLKDVNEVRNWLGSPILTSRSAQAGISILGNGGSGGFSKSHTLNGAIGFDAVGLQGIVSCWLDVLFPEQENGGIICFIDNMEELKDSRTALSVMEELRDSLFRVHGIRWIISGAEGMVRAGLSSPKMSGVFQTPIELKALPQELAIDVVKARQEHFAEDAEAQAPISAEAFARLFERTGSGLRFALNLCERYVVDSDPEELLALSPEERERRFFDFVGDESKKVFDAYSINLTKADWRVFSHLLSEKAGACSPSDFADFGYAAMPSLLVRVEKLAKAGLVSYSKQDEDRRRRQISVTKEGRMAFYHKTFPISQGST